MCLHTVDHFSVLVKSAVMAPDISEFDANRHLHSSLPARDFRDEADNIGAMVANFADVEVPFAGTYNLEVDYFTQGPRSFFVTVNDQSVKELDLNGYSFSTPTSTVIQVQLTAGKNQIVFDNPSNYAPDLDSITISPLVF
jgi:hypothetical protein